jgi:pimeloyl-ACP methyl ester carboxylesterase
MIERKRTTFPSGGIDCVGYVYCATDEAAQRPGIVMAHGFGGTQEGSLARTAGDFAAAGFAVLTFDYRSFGESDGTPRQVISLRDQQCDWHAALAHARRLPGIDPSRVALWGSSLSGAHVVAVAAEDSKVAAVVAQVPFNGFPRRVEGRTAAETWRLLRAIVKDWWRGKTGREPYYVPAVARRGELAVMAFDEADAVIRTMQNDTWCNAVAPRVLLDMMLWYRPERVAHRLAMPILVCLAERDRQTPAHLGRRIAERAPFGEMKQYPYGHFDFYRDEVRRCVVTDQIDFLKVHLLSTGISEHPIFTPPESQRGQ